MIGHGVARANGLGLTVLLEIVRAADVAEMGVTDGEIGGVD